METIIIIEVDETDYISQNEVLMEQIKLSIQTHEQSSGYKPTDEEINALLFANGGHYED